METQLTKLRRFMANGQYHEALGLAASWSELGEHRDAITKARSADVYPDWYHQLGQDPQALVQAGIQALWERYGKSLCLPEDFSPTRIETMSKSRTTTKNKSKSTSKADVVEQPQVETQAEQKPAVEEQPTSAVTPQPVVKPHRKTAPYFTGIILKKHGIEQGVTKEMIEEYHQLRGKTNEGMAETNLSWALQVIRGFTVDQNVAEK